jgi:hypothetical protein
LSHQDPTVLSEDKELMDTWLADEGTWESVFPVKSYEYLEIIVRGDTQFGIEKINVLLVKKHKLKVKIIQKNFRL